MKLWSSDSACGMPPRAQRSQPPRVFCPHPDSTSKRWNEVVDPSMELSDNGRAVIVYWKKGVFRIYVFSLPPAVSLHPQ